MGAMTGDMPNESFDNGHGRVNSSLENKILNGNAGFGGMSGQYPSSAGKLEFWKGKSRFDKTTKGQSQDKTT
jgi:hypothetical protein